MQGAQVQSLVGEVLHAVPYSQKNPQSKINILFLLDLLPQHSPSGPAGQPHFPPRPIRASLPLQLRAQTPELHRLLRPLPLCIGGALGESLSLSLPWFHLLFAGNNNGTNMVELWGRLKEFV